MNDQKVKKQNLLFIIIVYFPFPGVLLSLLIGYVFNKASYSILGFIFIVVLTLIVNEIIDFIRGVK